MDKLICAGKNYLDHAKEMKDAIPEKPVLFLKPPSVLRKVSQWNAECVLHLPFSAKENDIHYECELVFLIGQNGYNLSEKEALASLTHVTVGLDMTNRGLQKKAKETGGPWEMGKVFPDAAVIGPWIPLENVDLYDLTFEFSLNGEIRQQDNITHMRMNPVELLQYASEYFPLCAGDVLFTGTPAGVGPVKSEDIGRLSLLNHQYSVRWE